MTDHTTAAQAASESAFPEQTKFDRLYNRTFKGYGLDAERLAHAELFWKEGHELGLLSKLRAPVVDEQNKTAISQFLTDVMTAAGLVAHGKQCRALADRLGKACMDLRLSAAQASAETLVRYCPGCGSIGPVEEKYRDCCPDGNQARMIPAPLAEKCRDTFRIAIKVLLADAAANDGAAPQASEAVRNAVLEEAASVCDSWLMAAPSTELETMANQTMERMGRNIRALKMLQVTREPQ